MSSKQAGFSQSKVTEGEQQESREAAERAGAQEPGRLAAAGHTNTGQTLRQQVEGLKQQGDTEVEAKAEGMEQKKQGEFQEGGAPA